eukprot:TRINITY_DN775_c0_g1_i1.p1 TRINITY_DN775_c0_g1~~TRINITY_DN775_c0_g1_i1.p1  ORF type:complete len:238 (-),score=49.72 TRINITY_DN775_c0_g1_i1:22-633(-)
MAAAIRMEKIHLPGNGFAFVLHGVYTKEECEALIARTEKIGYNAALLNVGGGRQVYDPDTRKSSRCIIDDAVLAAEIFARVQPWVPEELSNMVCVGLNERCRFLKYNPGDYFAPHMDGTYVRENGERSILTLQLYLNEGFGGGGTRFLDYRGNVLYDCVPQTGSVLIFEHPLLHEGELLTGGVKYAMRTDIMYRKRTVLDDLR